MQAREPSPETPDWSNIFSMELGALAKAPLRAMTDKYLSQTKNTKSVDQYKDLKKYVFKNTPNINYKSLLHKF